MTLLSLFPKLASSNNLQCALQQSRNQAGHRLLLCFSSHHRDRTPSSQPPSFLLPWHPYRSWMSCCFHMRVLALLGRGGEGEPIETEVTFRKATSSWSWKTQAHHREPSSWVLTFLTHRKSGEIEALTLPSLCSQFLFMHPGEKVFWTEHAFSYRPFLWKNG